MNFNLPDVPTNLRAKEVSEKFYEKASQECQKMYDDCLEKIANHTNIKQDIYYKINECNDMYIKCIMAKLEEAGYKLSIYNDDEGDRWLMIVNPFITG